MTIKTSLNLFHFVKGFLPIASKSIELHLDLQEIQQLQKWEYICVTSILVPHKYLLLDQLMNKHYICLICLTPLYQIPIISCLKCTVNSNTVNSKFHQLEVYLTAV